jgi:hypothetical protein
MVTVPVGLPLPPVRVVPEAETVKEGCEKLPGWLVEELEDRV